MADMKRLETHYRAAVIGMSPPLWPITDPDVTCLPELAEDRERTVPKYRIARTSFSAGHIIVARSGP